MHTIQVAIIPIAITIAMHLHMMLYVATVATCIPYQLGRPA